LLTCTRDVPRKIDPTTLGDQNVILNPDAHVLRRNVNPRLNRNHHPWEQRTIRARLVDIQPKRMTRAMREVIAIARILNNRTTNPVDMAIRHTCCRGRDAGIRQMEDSFRLMQTKTIDLMQVHNLLDLRVHLPVLREWKKAGRIRYLGITHYHAGAHAEVEKLVKTGDFDFVQINYSMDEPEAEARLLPACADSGTATLINRPFSQAGLFGRVRGKPLPPWCADMDCTSWAQFFLKWIISNPAVTCAIPGTGRVAHIEDNMAACTGRLPDAAMRKKMMAYFASL